MTDSKSDNDKALTEPVIDSATEVSTVSVDDEAENKKTEHGNKKTSVSKSSSTDTGSSSKKSRRWTGVFILVVMIALVGAAGYWQWLQFENDKQSIAQQFTDQQQRTDRVQAQLQSLQQTIESTNQQLDQQQSTAETIAQQNSQLRQQVTGLRDQLRALTTTNNDDWKLAEAHYLTQLASQRLVMERNTTGALALLETADKIVRDFADPDLYPVREQLRADITQLKLAKSVDREGIYLSLSGINKALVLLPRPVPEDYNTVQNNQTAVSDSTEATTLSKIGQSFQKALERLQGYVRITHHDEPVTPLLPPEGQYYLLTSLRLLIESAQLAVMREQQTVYEDSLANAQVLLARYYPLSSEAKTLAQQLNELQHTNIIQTLPDISESQVQLTSYMEALHGVSNSKQPDDSNAASSEQSINPDAATDSNPDPDSEPTP